MNNDTKIMSLKESIAIKREKLDSIKRFSPRTNCIIELDGVKSNIQVVGLHDLILLASKIRLYEKSAKELGYELVISGFKAEDWLADITSKLDLLTRKEEERKLIAMEEKLTALLSDDKKVELEINEIESMLL